MTLSSSVERRFAPPSAAAAAIEPPSWHYSSQHSGPAASAPAPKARLWDLPAARSKTAPRPRKPRKETQNEKSASDRFFTIASKQSAETDCRPIQTSLALPLNLRTHHQPSASKTLRATQYGNLIRADRTGNVAHEKILPCLGAKKPHFSRIMKTARRPQRNRSWRATVAGSLLWRLLPFRRSTQTLGRLSWPQPARLPTIRSSQFREAPACAIYSSAPGVAKLCP
jgi:hypothetical protein